MAISGALSNGNVSLYDGSNGISVNINKTDASDYTANMSINGQDYNLQMSASSGELDITGDVTMTFTGSNGYYTGDNYNASISISNGSSTISGDGMSMSGDQNGISGNIYLNQVNESYAVATAVADLVIQDSQN